MTGPGTPTATIALKLVQIGLIFAQWAVSIFYVVSALLMWTPFTYAPVTSKLVWFILILTPLISTFALSSKSLRRYATRVALLGALTFVQLGLMFALAILG